MEPATGNSLRLFLSVPIPPGQRPPLLELMRQLPRDGLKTVEPENLHFTLKFLGSVPSSQLPAIQSALRTVSFQPFEVALKGVGVFPDPNRVRIVWVGAESPGLESLAQKINDALAPFFPKEAFSAHLTIARVKQKVDLADFLSRWAGEEFGRFQVREFLLMKSTLGRVGSVYEPLAVFPCSGK